VDELRRRESDPRGVLAKPPRGRSGRVDDDGDGATSLARCVLVCRATIEDYACDNGRDDDCDGIIDCADSDCWRAPECSRCRLSERGACDNGVDDDCDGRTDCADRSCVGVPECA